MPGCHLGRGVFGVFGRSEGYDLCKSPGAAHPLGHDLKVLALRPDGLQALHENAISIVVETGSDGGIKFVDVLTNPGDGLGDELRMCVAMKA